MDLQVDEPLFYRLTLDGLLRRTLLVAKRGAPFIFGTAAVILLPPWLLTFLAFWTGTNLAEQIGAFAFYGSNLLGIVLTSMVSGILVYSVFKLLRGQPIPDISRSFSLTLERLISLVIASLLSGICIGLGFLFCIIPGLFVMAGLAVIAPVVMVEKAGPLEALNRSWELTEGYRWPIFCALMLIAMLQFGIDVGLLFLGTSAGWGSGFIEALEYVSSAVTTALGACVAGVAYHDLRMTKEELHEDDLLAVFE